MDYERANSRALLRLVAVKVLLLGLFLGGAAPAAATQEYILPTLFDVAGVAANDVLNIRAAPNASAEIIGTLTPNARDIEVVGYDQTGRWARINSREHTGWASLRFLSYRIDVWVPRMLPQTLHCFGNEPFWSLRAQEDDVVFSTPDTPETLLRVENVLSTGRLRDPRRTLSALSGSRRMTAVIVPMACSDGMSDRSFGLDVTLILKEGDALEMLTGCCSVAQS